MPRYLRQEGIDEVVVRALGAVELEDRSERLGDVLVVGERLVVREREPGRAESHVGEERETEQRGGRVRRRGNAPGVAAQRPGSSTPRAISRTFPRTRVVGRAGAGRPDQ